jgi:transketolase
LSFVRTAFIQELLVQARRHPDLFLVVGDLGYSVVEPFAREFPDRFLNAGVAEQNMTGVAAGLASEGWRVFTYSIANFPTLRCLEQIRNDVCYHNLSVTVVSVGAGVAYGNLGYSHHAVQDLGVMLPLPNLLVLSPADPGETRQCVTQLASRTGPAYLRLGKAGEPTLHDVPGLHRGPLCIREGRSAMALVATGSILSVALDAAREVERQAGTPVAVYSCPWLKPLSSEDLAPLWEHSSLISLEEHLEPGGFGDLLRRLKPSHVRLKSFSLSDEVCGMVGSQAYLRRLAGLTAESVAAAIAAGG